MLVSIARCRPASLGLQKIGGAESIALSGGYEDDADLGDVIIYTGQGGQENGRQVADQELKLGNLALCRNPTCLHRLTTRITFMAAKKQRQSKHPVSSRTARSSRTLDELLSLKSSSERELAVANKELLSLEAARSDAHRVVHGLYVQIAYNLHQEDAIHAKQANWTGGWGGLLPQRLTDAASRRVSALRDENAILMRQAEQAGSGKHYPGRDHRHFCTPDGRPSAVQAGTVWDSSVYDQERKVGILSGQVAELDREIAALRRSALAVERERIRKESLTRLRAKAASADGTARDLAATAKRNLANQTECPYCGGGLGATPHADHIYPLSKGGHSVASNMVLVCAVCNAKKSTMTLRAFILKYGLDREAVEHRLHSLGKDF